MLLCSIVRLSFTTLHAPAHLDDTACSLTIVICVFLVAKACWQRDVPSSLDNPASRKPGVTGCAAVGVLMPWLKPLDCHSDGWSSLSLPITIVNLSECSALAVDFNRHALVQHVCAQQCCTMLKNVQQQ